VVARYLVVANQTLGGEPLMNEIRNRIGAGPSSFYVLVPAIPVGAYSLGDVLANPEVGVPADTVTGLVEREETRRRRALTNTETRMSQLMSQIRAHGGEVEGDIGDTDPLKAIEAVMTSGPFDEVIISTLPLGVSRWLGLDVPHRVERRFKVPVTTVTAHS
jgi:hypothetical protein